MLMEKKIIKVVFDDKLNYQFVNEEELRTGSSRAVEMWFSFQKQHPNITLRLNVLLPNKQSLFEPLSEIYEDENNTLWYKWKIDKQYTKYKGQLLISLSAYTNDAEEVIFKTDQLGLYCEYSVIGEEEAGILTPTEYETLLFALSKKADLGDDGVVPRVQLPETLGRSFTNEQDVVINQTMVNNYDYCYKALDIQEIRLVIPNDIKQGYVSSISFKTTTIQPTIHIEAPENYEVIYMQNGIKTPGIIIPFNCAIIISIIYDGLFIYVYEKETDLE